MLVGAAGRGAVLAAEACRRPAMIWDNLNTHVSAAMQSFIDAHPGWLTVVRLPAYAPDPNPTEASGRT